MLNLLTDTTDCGTRKVGTLYIEVPIAHVPSVQRVEAVPGMGGF